MFSDGQYKAAVLVFEIKALRSGRLNQIIETKEAMLNSEISNHGAYMESSYQWLWPYQLERNDKPIEQAVLYRLSNPYDPPALTNTDNWRPEVGLESTEALQFLEDLKEGGKIQTRRMEKVLSHYEYVTHSKWFKMDGLGPARLST